MAEKGKGSRRAPVRPLRIVAVIVGLAIAITGGVISWGKGAVPASQTPVLPIRVRSETPASDGGANVLVVGESEAPIASDVMLTIAFDVRSVTSRHWFGRRLPDHQIKAEVLTEPGRPRLHTDPERVLAMQHLSLLAGEVERRTGSSLYARATRNLGVWVSVDGGAGWWFARAILIVGTLIFIAGLPIRRYGLRFSRGG
jgi:hypothetical protein